MLKKTNIILALFVGLCFAVVFLMGDHFIDPSVHEIPREHISINESSEEFAKAIKITPGEEASWWITNRRHELDAQALVGFACTGTTVNIMGMGQPEAVDPRLCTMPFVYTLRYNLPTLKNVGTEKIAIEITLSIMDQSGGGVLKSCEYQEPDWDHWDYFILEPGESIHIVNDGCRLMRGYALLADYVTVRVDDKMKEMIEREERARVKDLPDMSHEELLSENIDKIIQRCSWKHSKIFGEDCVRLYTEWTETCFEELRPTMPETINRYEEKYYGGGWRVKVRDCVSRYSRPYSDRLYKKRRERASERRQWEWEHGGGREAWEKKAKEAEKRKREAVRRVYTTSPIQEKLDAREEDPNAIRDTFQDGVSSQYYDDGTIKFQQDYNGSTKVFYPDGSLKVEFIYDPKIGETQIKTYNPDGTLKDVTIKESP